jgi:hypothetical protein
MAVAHSAASESHTGATGSANQAAFSWTHTQTGTPQGVVVFVSTFVSNADLITSVTYGGVALTRLAGGLALDNAGETGRLDTFFLGSGLGTGNQTITVNRTNNATVMYAAAATVTAGANTAVPTQTIVLLQGDGTLAAQTVNDTSPGQNSVRYAGCYSGLNAPPTAGTGSTLLNSIDIGNYGSALVRETTAGQGARSIGFTGATDDRAAVHLAIRELVPRTETPIVASFTLTGNDATFTKTSPKVIEPVVGAFALTGNPADLRHNPDLEAGTGTFALNGQPADTRHNVRITAETGAFSFTGNPATFTKATPKAIAADRGQFTLTGNDATLRRNYAITAEVGTFTITGQPATLHHNPRIEANTGSFALTGGQPALLVGRYLSGGRGEFTETGQPATFRRTWTLGTNKGTFVLTGITPSLTKIGAYEIDPFPGTFTLDGQQAQLAQSRSLSVDAGQFTLTGNPATLTQGHVLVANAGQYQLTGNPATLTQGYRLTADTGAFALTGNPATLSVGRAVVAQTGTFTLTGNSATLTEQATTQLSADTGAFTLSGQQATFRVTRALTGQTGVFTFTGNNAIFTEAGDFQLPVDTGAFILTGLSATLAKTSTARRRNVLIF